MDEVDRRVYRRELEELTGWGATWIRSLEKQGKIPRGRVDEGGKRKWWPLSEVREIVAGRRQSPAQQTSSQN